MLLVKESVVGNDCPYRSLQATGFPFRNSRHFQNIQIWCFKRELVISFFIVIRMWYGIVMIAKILGKSNFTVNYLMLIKMLKKHRKFGYLSKRCARNNINRKYKKDDLLFQCPNLSQKAVWSKNPHKNEKPKKLLPHSGWPKLSSIFNTNTTERTSPNKTQTG